MNPDEPRAKESKEVLALWRCPRWPPAGCGRRHMEPAHMATQIQLLPWEECGAGVIVHKVRPRSIPKANGTLL